MAGLLSMPVCHKRNLDSGRNLGKFIEIKKGVARGNISNNLHR